MICKAFSKILSRTKKKDGCLIWTGGHSGFGRGGGYGRVYFGGRMRAAHRVIFEKFKGPIPEGMQIDHTCSNRLCCNPLHLEAVSQSENMKRAYKRRRCNIDHSRAIRKQASKGKAHG